MLSPALVAFDRRPTGCRLAKDTDSKGLMGGVPLSSDVPPPIDTLGGGTLLPLPPPTPRLLLPRCNGDDKMLLPWREVAASGARGRAAAEE